MTSGSIAKARTYLRTSYARIGVLLFLVFGITVLLAHHPQAPTRAASPIATAATGVSTSWTDTLLRRVADWIPEDDEWEDFRINDRSSYEEDFPETDPARQQKVLKKQGPRDHWCSEAEYLDGLWVKRKEAVTPQNIRKIFKITVRSFSYILTHAHSFCVERRQPTLSTDRIRSWPRICRRRPGILVPDLANGAVRVETEERVPEA
jgi:hypothetical protein